MDKESCFSFFSLLCCGTPRKNGSTKTSDAQKVKIRIGFDGKDTPMDPTNMNVKSTFGTFAVLLDYSTNEVVPLNGAGFVVEPLDPRRKYVVVVNTHGSSPKRWEYLRGDKHHGKHKHKHSHSRSKKKKSSKSKEKGKEKEKGAEEMDVLSQLSEHLSSADIGISSSSTLLTSNSTPNNGDEEL